jgi:MYXO-CTERM domain-containing protein
MTRTHAWSLALALALALPVTAHAQPLDVTWTEITPAYALATNTHWGSGLSWDGTRLLVRSDTRVDVYTFDGTTAPAFEAQISPSSGDTNGFPASAVIDQGRVLVGANDTVNPQQHVFEFQLSGTTWSQVSYTTNPMSLVGDDTIVAMALDGPRWAIGAPYVGGNVGEVDLVRSPGTAPFTWTTSNRTEVVGRQQQELFGHIITLRGADLLVSAIRGFVGGVEAGRITLYTDTGTSLTQVVSIDDPTPAQEDQFGFLTALDDTYIYAAAHYDDTNANDAGALYIFDRSGGTHQTIFGTVANGGLGGGLAVDGDWMALGAPTTGPGMGHLFLYQRDASGMWRQRADIPAIDGASGTAWGSAMVVRGRVIVAGAFAATAGGVSGGGRAWFAHFTEPDGNACGVDSDCTHGHCVSGICCSTACTDAGTDAAMTDAGTDAAVVASDAGSDAGLVNDAGGDAAIVATDASSTDAGRTTSDASTADVSLGTDAGGVPRIPLSCTCRAGAPTTSRIAFLVMALVIAIAARRKRR